MTDIDEILATIDELEPYPDEYPEGEEESLYRRVARARQAIAATFGMSVLQLIRAERNQPTKAPK
jgi:hypothetical protein